MVSRTWSKSSYSNSQGGACVEARTAWRKSSYSNAQGAQCVEIAEVPHSVLIRDTQNRGLGHLSFGGTEWASFLSDVKAQSL